MDDDREIRRVKYYDDRKRWKDEIGQLIYNLVYEYNFYYSGCAVYPINNTYPNFNHFLERFKKNTYKHYHKIVLYKVYYQDYAFTPVADRYVLAIFKKNTIDLYTLSSLYSESSNYIVRAKTAQTFINAFEEASKLARHDKEVEELYEIQQLQTEDSEC